ncbi:MAG: T9SS type A sorting domain-containing protein, partial [Bacteroidota bacterium]
QVISIAEPLVSVDEKPALPISFSLEQNYPNPFNPTTTIKFQIPNIKSQRTDSQLEFGDWSLGFVSLKVFDVLGREVRTLVNEELKAGSYGTTFDAHLRPFGSGGQASGLASGLYFYQLKSGRFQQTKKMLLLR